MKPVVASLRSQGVRLVIYLDDILIIAFSIETLNRHKTLAISLLKSLGFLINYEKSNLTPSNKLCSWELLVELVSMQFTLPQHKYVQIHKECRLLLNTNRPTIRHLSRVLGLLDAMSPSRMVCPTSIPSTTNSSDKRSSEMGELQHPSGFDTISQIRPIMVGKRPYKPRKGVQLFRRWQT